MIEARGIVYGRAAVVTLDAGQLTGDPVAIARVRSAVEYSHEVLLVGFGGGIASLAEPLIAAATLASAFDVLTRLNADEVLSGLTQDAVA